MRLEHCRDSEIEQQETILGFAYFDSFVSASFFFSEDLSFLTGWQPLVMVILRFWEGN
jgi:hypothetical protein